MDRTYIDMLAAHIDRSPTCYHVAANAAALLRENGYTRLEEVRRWQLQPGGKYFMERGGSALIAFRVPAKRPEGFRMAAAHGDSPCFKLKENAALREGGYLRLNTEVYGGLRMSTWFDRPLSVAGRLLTEMDGAIRQTLVNIDRDLLVIPSVAVHFDRGANEGVKYRANVDTLPLAGSQEAEDILALAAETAGVRREDILGSDLHLYCRQPGAVLGSSGELFLAPRLDDQACVWGCLQGFLESAGGAAYMPVFCLLDHEEVGSATPEGAASSLVRDVLRRAAGALGIDEEGYQMLLARSMLVSADNAHAVHPNHPEFSDRDNAPHLGGGVVLKFSAQRRYATDGISAAAFRAICRRADVPLQTMLNRSDLPGGSTLGSIAGTLLPVGAVDIGLAQLAMHSAVEVMGAEDYPRLIAAMRQFYSEG